MTEPEPPDGKRVGRTPFIVGKFIAGGSYGRVHIGKNEKTGKEVAVKLEAMSSTRPQLPLEYAFYKMLLKHVSLPVIHAFDSVGEKALNTGWHAMVMDLLGPSLKDMHEKCDNWFSLQTTTQLMIQLIALFEHFHGRRLVYRDMKPDNFLLGLPKTDHYNIVHVVDLGLCKEYSDEKGKHIPQQSGKMWTGTVRYMSINNHMNKEQSRRDDLEALGYMIIYLYKGSLPWQGVQKDNVVDKYREIGQIKRKTKYSQLCDGMPEEFARYMYLVRQLGFEDEPKYKDYIKMFVKLLKKFEIEFTKGVYDWDKNHNIIANRVKIPKIANK